MLDFEDLAIGVDDDERGERPTQPVASAHPPSEDCPQSAGDVAALFPSDIACRRFIEQLRWGTSFHCPECHAEAAPWRSSLGLVACTSCRRMCTPVHGTAFQGSSPTLTRWFAALWAMVSEPCGTRLSAVAGAFGFANANAAWQCLEKLRPALAGPERLRDDVEVDEWYLEYATTGEDGTPERRRVVVVAALELRGGHLGRIRLHALAGNGIAHAAEFVARTVAPGSRVTTDRVREYASLRAIGYDHAVVAPNGAPDPTYVEMPNLARIVPLLQGWFDATGPIPSERLGYYLDEFAFRFDTRALGDRGERFHELARRVATSDPADQARRHRRSSRPARTSSGVRLRVDAATNAPSSELLRAAAAPLARLAARAR